MVIVTRYWAVTALERLQESCWNEASNLNSFLMKGRAYCRTLFHISSSLPLC